MATLVAGLAIAAAPLAATPAQADSGTDDFQVTVSPRNDSNLSFEPLSNWFKLFETEFDEAGLTIAPAADGTFNLQNSSGCLEEQSSSQLHLPSTCPTSGAWALQRANDGSDYFLIRHVIDDRCLTPAEVSSAGKPHAVGVGTAHLRCRSHGQPGLAHPAGTGECQDPGARE
ncbi:hypothetical protein ABVG11_02275 [Streptomyces sp. HD1123-B1]|uniref:hypothetical protein n=1 Tax=Streptomyces huangiella TaxID=3228804 RepID=UPI003D7CF5EB